MVALDEALTLTNSAVPYQRRGVVKHDDIDLLGAQSTTCITGKAQLKIEATVRVEVGVMPDRNIDIRQGSRISARLRADQHRGDHALMIESVPYSVQRRLIERRNARLLIDDNHRSHRP